MLVVTRRTYYCCLSLDTMNKKTDWSIIAQCDYFAVKRFVQTAGREAMCTVVPMRETLFERKITRDVAWREAYEAVCQAYNQLKPNFAIRQDNFGGYCLAYTGKVTVQASTIFRRVPIGFVRAVPDGVVTDLSVMSSQRTGEQLLLLGPLRFVNSDCSPNCEYEFSSSAGYVELRVKRRINPGEEILVKYGPEFFEFRECQCRTCEVKRREDTFFRHNV